MISVEIVPCEPHRGQTCLVVVGGLRRRPVTSRFSIAVQEDNQTRYVSRKGIEDKFTECREVCAGWDADKKILWLILGPEVCRVLEHRSFAFTLLLSGDKAANLTLPPEIMRDGPPDAEPVVRSVEKGVPALLPVPPHAYSQLVEQATPKPRQPLAQAEAPPPEPEPRAAADEVSAAATAVHPEEPPAWRAPENEPAAAPALREEELVDEADDSHKAPSIGPVVVGVIVVLGAAMGVAYLLSSGGGDKEAKAPPVSVAATAPAPTRPLVIPAPPVKPPAVPSAAAPPAAAPAPSVVSAPSGSSASPAPVPAAPAAKGPATAGTKPGDAAKPPAPAAPPAEPAHAEAAGGCGGIATPAGLGAIPAGLSPADALCVARVWSEAGRVDDALAALSVLDQAGFVPAILELAELYDPRSNRSDPPAEPDFARAHYARVIQQASDEAIREEAKRRLDAMGAP